MSKNTLVTHTLMSLPVLGPATELHRRLTLLDAVMLNMGSMIGSGIFFVPAAISLSLPYSSLYLGVWVLGGVVSLLGALSLAELGAALPRAGGHYVYIREAYGPIFGFMSGWTSFAAVMTGSIAAVAVAFAQCLSTFLTLTELQIKVVAIASIWLLTAVNTCGVKLGTRVQNSLTFLKLAALALLILLGITLSGGRIEHFSPVFHTQPWAPWIPAMGLAMVGVLWAYDGWIQITYVAGEIQNPQKTIPRALLISTLGIIVLYTLINAVYVYVLSLHQMAHLHIVASDTAQVLLGPVGGVLISLAILVSTFGANNGFILGGARIYYAMAKDGAFFPPVARLNAAGVPLVSLLIQAVWASVLTASGSFHQLFTYVIFASWLFYALSCGAVLILRRTQPELERPYKVWGYPFVPLIFILFALGLVLNTVLENPVESAIGVGIILLGLPAYYYCKSLAKVSEA